MTLYRFVSVWEGPPIDVNEAIKFITRHMDREPVSLQKLSIEDDMVSCLSDESTKIKLDAFEFLARLSAQILDKWESLVRYFRIYSH
ncbi:MAG: hypothetical protein GYA55_01775 [SAR324 cluster bacterium]|uniref:Uncharacterized protein n=1 Tax=SAR324 cluster bacterium TaxID=2024889 RepID=A0A7X9FPH5_9DELT|nr:hypothetical protein [SAR324 cluster bacterium]